MGEKRMGRRKIRIISWNVNGFRAAVKKDFFTSIKHLDPDILLLQETKLQADQRTHEMIGFPGYDSHWAYSSFKKGYSGVAAYTRIKPEKITPGIGLPKFDDEGRILQLDFKDFILFNIYFPNGQMNEERLQYKLDFYQAFFDHADSLKNQGKSLIITGDFNTAHNEIDLKNPKANSTRSGFLPVERQILDKIVEKGYVDTFRHFNPETIKYSWWSYRFNARANNAGWRIDYFFATQDIINNKLITSTFIDNKTMGSDHCPVGLELTI